MRSNARRSPRPGGRRRSAVPWTALTYVALAGVVVIPGSFYLLTGFNQVLNGLYLALLMFVGCVAMSRRQALPQADSIDDFAAVGDSVLFLRPFRGEQAPFSQSDERHGRHRVKGLFVAPNEEFPSFERYVGPELTAQIGPIIGLGAPGDRLPPEGPVVRHYAPDVAWQAQIERLIPAVRCIVMLPQTSAPLREELRLIRAHGAVEKLFLVLSPYDEPGEQRTGRSAPVRLRTGRAFAGARHPRWSELVTVFAEHGLLLPPRHPGPGTVLGFRADGHAVLLASGLDRAADYATAIASRVRGA